MPIKKQNEQTDKQLREKKPEDWTQEDVTSATEYHDQYNKDYIDTAGIPQETQDNVDDFLQDYLKNNARLAFEAQLADEIQDLKDSGQPYNLNYSEPAVPLLPMPCVIETNKNGVQIPRPINPEELQDKLESNEDVAVVCFIPAYNKDHKTLETVKRPNHLTKPGSVLEIPCKISKSSTGMQVPRMLSPRDLFSLEGDINFVSFIPAYEQDKSHLKVVKSNDLEFKSLNDDNMPTEGRALSSMIKMVVQKYEENHKEQNKEIDKNKYVLAKIANFAKIEISNIKTDYSIVWEDFTKDEKVLAVIKHYNLFAEKDPTLFIQTLSAAIKQNILDTSKILTQTNKCR